MTSDRSCSVLSAVTNDAAAGQYSDLVVVDAIEIQKSCKSGRV